RSERMVEHAGIGCDLVGLDACLLFRPGEKVATLEEEVAAVRRAGLPVSRLAKAPLDFFDTGPCIRYPQQGQFHPLKYIAGLARAIEYNRGQLFTGTHVDHVKGGKDAYVMAGGYTVSAQ